MNLLRRLLSLRFFSRKKPAEGPIAIILWWEARRIPFNLLVGAAGILTLVIVHFDTVLSSEFLHEQNDPFDSFFLMMVVFYGLAANLCYTGGWVAEILARRLWTPDQAGHFAVISFFFGLLFAVGLTLAPAVLFTLSLVLHLIAS